MSSGLWVPGSAGPQEDLIDRIHRRIQEFVSESGHAFVAIELADGVRYEVESLSPEPGYGFVTLRPHQDGGTPGEVIVPVGSIRRIELSTAAEEHGRLGFSLPSP